MPHRPTVPRTRREALRSMGFGLTALASLIGNSAVAAPGAAVNPWSVKQPHFPPKAGRVIFVFLSGGLSAIDSFDHKPLLDTYDGKPLPATPRTGFATGNLMRSPFAWTRYGRNGTAFSEIFAAWAASSTNFARFDP